MAEEKKRGPKGGIRHQPGRGHDSKSRAQTKKRFIRNAAKKRRDKEEEARRLWEEWDRLPDDAKKLLGRRGEPKVARPRDAN